MIEERLRDECRVYNITISKQENINVVGVSESMWECQKECESIRKGVRVSERMWECRRGCRSVEKGAGVSERM